VIAPRAALLALAALALAGAVAGGLLRACPAPAPPTLPAWLAAGAAAHAALMICGFLGTVVGLERAVAVRHPAALLAPLASGLGGACMLAGRFAAGAWLFVAAGVAFVLVNLVVVRRQPAAHTRLLLVGALAWLAGSVAHLRGAGEAPLAWWFAFLVTTIAAERLEMTRLTRRGPAVERLLWVVVATMLSGAALSGVPVLGGALFGGALVLLAGWLFAFDVARRTIRAPGLARYMAVCLLAGYTWLALAGAAWVGVAAGWPLRDVALHALGLGFVVSMMMAHAPVILPAVARVKLLFGAVFYVPLAVLHASLVVRLGLGLTDAVVRGIGASLDALALVLFALTVAGSALAWRIVKRVPRTRGEQVA